MTRIIKQCWRGCGWLPHVGAHPGTVIFIGLVLVTGMAGAKGSGSAGFAVASLAGLLVYGPMYLYGAYSRAQLSDSLERRSIKEKP